MYEDETKMRGLTLRNLSPELGKKKSKCVCLAQELSNVCVSKRKGRRVRIMAV